MRFIARFLGFLFATGTILFVLGAAAAGGLIYVYSKDLPDYTQLKNYEPPIMTRIHAGDGSILAEYAHERRLYLPSYAIPKLVKEAFVSAEDKNFYHHHGIDPEGVVRAVMVLLQGTRHVQGASTITQQVAKNFLLTNERSFNRKIKEALLSLRIEQAYSKDRILELYLNEIYLGLGNYGIAAAALNYFDKSVNELTLAEAAYLAGLPKGPNNYNPFRNREAAIARRNYVIERMVENGYVTRKEGDAAMAEPLNVNPRVLSPDSMEAGYFAEEVRRELNERYGDKKLYEGGLSVRTTLDPKMQLMARKALVDGLVRFDEAHGYRGPIKQIDIGADWGQALGQVPALGDVAPWRLAVVLDVNDSGARIGLQPPREKSGDLSPQRVTGVIPPEGARWTRKRLRQALTSGDVVYVEPMDDKPGMYRLRQVPEISGALIAMDPYTGRVFAMVGGFSFDQSSFNRATQALRQPGSSFKPIVYSAALDNGYTPSSIILDEPIEIVQPNGDVWRPENFESGHYGPHTLRYGVEHSKNLMTVRLARDIGMPLIAEYARRFGVYDDMLPVLSMSLGAGETTLMRMVTAYSMLDNGGKRLKPTLIDRIQDRWGHTIYRHDDRECLGCDAQKYEPGNLPKLVDHSEQVIDPLTAYQMTSIMEGVIQRGTGVSIKVLNRHLAGKTGTTNDAKDLWFVGYSPDLTVGVYLGYDKPRSTGASAQAALYAAPIFRDFMKMALTGKPDTPFRVPPGIKLISVDLRTGMRSSGPGSILEAFKPGTAPPESYSGGGGGGGGAAGTDQQVGSGTGGLY
ncbi:penicillin-binding protein 1A [Rhodoblastus acidophilus]|uniref:Penicillin-binding protein 1A n=1 Tax=Candidatus Rhodoblastus alkanivorans TaxID=2954117 RepID=A0ABS9Z7Y5_9HYPH|nr:penicillin-binding protein 1A [Candidatus Rhodoblastus alkanivorans]MCI4679561.1 penicillin-binding protein 1A [Candidatus Rhodoblastus alkanivorans]MCI4683312.1 penicillin-binding protein 1A [Candidatus Rhodoblastus alkanivorans]MDI4640625.1 penicillin-binding protein 1A [Rhodoblastus acidophilus]